MFGLFLRQDARAEELAFDDTKRGYTAWLALPLSVMVVLAACSSEDNANQQSPSPVGAGTGGTAGAPPAVVPGGTSSTPMPVTPTPGATAGTTPGSASGTAAGVAGAGGATGMGPVVVVTPPTTGGTGGTAGTGGTGSTGGTGGTGGGAPLKTMCKGGEMMGCSSFVLPSGKELSLGPLGAAMEVNVGKGFENMLSPDDTDASCADFASLFGQSAESTAMVVNSMGIDLKLYTVYHPANWEPGKKYPLLSWGNGTCAQPEGYGTLLRFIASHGFVVVAANSRYVGVDNAMKHALDFMFKANDDMTSPYYQKIDTTKVGAMGHSQGSGATSTLSSDPRVQAVILYNGTPGASKPFFAVSGDKDLAGAVSGFRSAVNGAAKAAYIFFHMIPSNGSLLDLSGHLTLMTQPERLTDASVAWWKLVLQDDPASKEYFVGASCKLCNKAADFDFGQKGL